MTWNTTTFTDGLYDVRVVTTDNVGNSAASAVVAGVRVDNTAPTVTMPLASGATGASTNAGKIFFKSNAAGSYRLVADGDRWWVGPGVGVVPDSLGCGLDDACGGGGVVAGRGSVPVEWVLVVEWCVGAGDVHGDGGGRGGEHGDECVHVHRGRTAPTGAVTAPVAAANVRGNAVAVTSNSADAGSGVASAQFQGSPAGAGTWIEHRCGRHD